MTVLALDFDGVLCDGRAEYLEASARAYGHFWPPSSIRISRVRDPFFRLRAVVMSGWEMPALLRALVLGESERAILRDWPRVRDRVLAAGGVDRDALVARLRRALDDVRRDWTWIDRDGWLAHHRPYAPLDRVRRVVAAPDRTIVVTTKEGAFARLILDGWALPVDEVRGKEAGEHKCEKLTAVIESAAAGAAPDVAFVEDRMETLECVVRCSAHEPRLRSVRLFLAAWGYTTPHARERARRHARIRLLTLAAFLRGPASWPA